MTNSTLTINDIPSALQTQIIASAFKYQRQYYGKIIVIKASGKIVKDTNALNHFVDQVLILRDLGMKPIVVHGAGTQITTELEKAGYKSSFDKAGLRISAKEHLPIIDSVARATNTIVCDTFKTRSDNGVYAVGMNAYDPEIRMLASPIAPKKNNFSSDTVTQLQVGRLMHMLESPHAIPVITNMARDTQDNLINVNADPVAAAIAIELQASRLLMCSDVAGVKDENGVIMKDLTQSRFRALAKQGVIAGGMKVKVRTAFNIAQRMPDQGAVVIMNDDFIQELMSENGAGTKITKPKSRTPKATIA